MDPTDSEADTLTLVRSGHEVLIEAMRQAAELCLTEANRWERLSPGVAAHWRMTAQRLLGGVRGLEIFATLDQPKPTK